MKDKVFTPVKIKNFAQYCLDNMGEDLDSHCGWFIGMIMGGTVCPEFEGNYLSVINATDICKIMVKAPLNLQQYWCDKWNDKVEQNHHFGVFMDRFKGTNHDQRESLNYFRSIMGS